MKKISTKNLSGLPNINTLKKLCKSLATLDAIICPEWEYRYYSYNRNWDEKNQEEFFQMRDGEGNEFQIFFNTHGALINGFAHESEMNGWTEKTVAPKYFFEKVASLFGYKKKVDVQIMWPGVIDNVPKVFHSFIFGEPIKSIGTTFCIWHLFTENQWRTGKIKPPVDDFGDGSESMISILDNNPETYRQHASEYYDETFVNGELDINLIKQIYEHIPLNSKMISVLNPNLENFETLKNDLNEIGYEFIDL